MGLNVWEMSLKCRLPIDERRLFRPPYSTSSFPKSSNATHRLSGAVLSGPGHPIGYDHIGGVAQTEPNTSILITDINLYIHFSHMNCNPICPILDNMSNIGLIKLYLRKQITNRAGLVSKWPSNYILGKKFLISDMSVISWCPILDKYWTNVRN